RKNSRVVFARRWKRCHLPGRCENRGRSASHHGNPAARQRTFDGSPVHSGRTADAPAGTGGRRTREQINEIIFTWHRHRRWPGGGKMLSQNIFRIDMALGYLAFALLIGTYVWPRLKRMDQIEAHRAIAAFNSFRFFGLVFLLPGFVGANLPQSFATPVAYGDLITALLAILALLTVRVRSVFWPLVWALNLV